MQQLFKIILDRYPTIYISIHVNIFNNLVITISLLEIETKDSLINKKSFVEVPLYNLENKSFDWRTVANVLLNTLKAVKAA